MDGYPIGRLHSKTKSGSQPPRSSGLTPLAGGKLGMDPIGKHDAITLRQGIQGNTFSFYPLKPGELTTGRTKDVVQTVSINTDPKGSVSKGARNLAITTKPGQPFEPETFGSNAIFQAKLIQDGDPKRKNPFTTDLVKWATLFLKDGDLMALTQQPQGAA